MTTRTRTDIHRPSAPEFDPEGYTFHGCFDLHPEEGSRNRVQVVSALVETGLTFHGAPHGSGQCSHCGARIRYAALMSHPVTKTLLWIGETCLDNRFSLTKGEFDALRKDARLNAERTRKAEKIAALLETYPDLVWASYAYNIEVAGGETVYFLRDDWEQKEYATEAEARALLAPQVRADFWAVGENYKRGTTFVGQVFGVDFALTTMNDIWHKVERYGDISEKQAAFVSRLVTQVTEKYEAHLVKQAAAAVKVATGVQVPTGKVTIEGKVTSVKFKDNDFGGTWKMTVEHADGWKVWGSVPASLDGIEAGAVVRFNATVEAKDGDPLFGFFKRPTKAVKVS